MVGVGRNSGKNRGESTAIRGQKKQKEKGKREGNGRDGGFGEDLRKGGGGINLNLGGPFLIQRGEGTGKV